MATYDRSIINKYTRATFFNSIPIRARHRYIDNLEPYKIIDRGQQYEDRLCQCCWSSLPISGYYDPKKQSYKKS